MKGYVLERPGFTIEFTKLTESQCYDDLGLNELCVAARDRAEVKLER